MEEHAKEPWHIDSYHNIMTPDGQLGLGGIKTHCTLGDGMRKDRANARRIVACVNACAWIPTEQLEAAGTIAVERQDEMQAELLKAWKQRDELLAALQDLLHAFPGEYSEPPLHISKARAAIASVKGGAA